MPTSVTATAKDKIDINQYSQSGVLGFTSWPKDFFTYARAGGLNNKPKSLVTSGLKPSWTISAAAPAATPAAVTIDVTTGTAMLDEQEAELSVAAQFSLTPAGIGAGDNYFRFFLNPTREIQTVVMSDLSGTHVAPTTRLNGDPIQDGDGYVICGIEPSQLIAYAYYKRVRGAWVETDMTYLPTPANTQQGQFKLLSGKTIKKVTASNFTVNAIEGWTKYGTITQPWEVPSAPRGIMRNSSSLQVFTANLYYYVLPLDVTATFTNGSDTVTLDYDDRAVFSDIVNSILNTNTLEIDGAALDAAGYAASTGVITLAANYTGTTGTKQVTITPVTPANIYVRSTSKSELTLPQQPTFRLENS